MSDVVKVPVGAFALGMRRLALLAAALLSVSVFAQRTDDSQVGATYAGVALLPFRYVEWPSPEASVTGFRLGLLASRHESVTGVDLSTFVSYADSGLRGLSFSTVNSHGEAYGLQVGLVNATGCGCGAQLGFWNMAEDYRGLQVGIGNFAHRMCGVQIGLGNVITESPFSTCIILNACF